MSPRLCFSPGWTCGPAVLGAVQIMVGLFNMGLGPGRTSTHPGDLSSLGAAYWLGAVFVVTGILSVLVGQFPSACLLGFAVFMNIVSALFAITGVVLYAIDLSAASLLWMCNGSDDASCRKVALFAQSLLTYMDATLICLAVLQLAVSVLFAVQGIRALIGGMKKKEEEACSITTPA